MEISISTHYISPTPPAEFLTKYFYACLDGDICIMHNSKSYALEGILLVELGQQIKKWLKEIDNIETKNFKYDSMDFEDTVFSFTKVNDSELEFSSIEYPEYEAFRVSKNKLRRAFEKYLQDLSYILKKSYETTIEDSFSRLKT